MIEHTLPDQQLVLRARRRVDAVRAALRARGRDRWVAYAITGVMIRPDEWVLYAITQRTSLPISRDMAASLALQPAWVSGARTVDVLPVDFDADADGTSPAYALELRMVVWPPRVDGRVIGPEGASLLVALLDAREGPGVRVVLAMPDPPLGWPR